MPALSRKSEEILAIGTPCIGAYSETFIRRHVNDLAPGRTVAFTTDPPRDFWDAECPVLKLYEHRRRSSWAPHYRAMRRFGIADVLDRQEITRFLKTHGVTVLMGEWLQMALPWMKIAKSMGIRFFAHAHGIDVSKKIKNPYYRWQYVKFNNSDGLIVMSRYARDKLKAIGLSKDKIFVVPYGIDVPDAPLRRETKDSGIRCLAVGRMVRKKAPLMTLKAFLRSIEELNDLTLDYVGDGELFEEAQRFVHASGIADKVRFHGPLDNEAVVKLMDKSDIFIQHSIVDPETGDEEGLPVAILEAMSHSLPVISTRHAGIPEAVQENLEGLLVAENDWLGMAENIVHLASDRRLRLNMGYSAWVKAKREFSWEQEKNTLLKILALE